MNTLAITNIKKVQLNKIEKRSMTNQTGKYTSEFPLKNTRSYIYTFPGMKKMAPSLEKTGYLRQAGAKNRQKERRARQDRQFASTLSICTSITNIQFNNKS